jgi:dynein heavy chain
MLKTLEHAVKNGLPLLIEDIGETVDASIDPILLKQVYVKGDTKYVRLGDSEIEYHDKFRLYLTTKIANPTYLPETQIKVTMLNFFVTRSGLEDQLLASLIMKEAFEVEEKRNKSIAAMAKDRKSLNDIEDRILLLLSESQGNILDDSVLIDTLEESKFTSTLIQGRMQDNVITQEIVAATREKYRSVAQRGSILYFCVADLALIDTMYQYSLSYFFRLFNMCIDQAEKSDVLAERLESLINYMTRSIFVNISRGLFEAHKHIYGFLMTTSILRERGDISQLEWNLLLRDGSSSVPKKKMSEITEQMLANPNEAVVSVFSWKYLTMLDYLLPAFKGIVQDMALRFPIWHDYIKQADPQSAPLPGTWGTKLGPFHRLLLLKALRFEKVALALNDYVALTMGKTFVTHVQTSLEEVYRDTDRMTPVIFVLSQGADPTGLLFRFAKEKKYDEKLNVISLGQGQGENAAKMIEQARQRGEWVLLQNAHLSKSWMPALEEIVDSFANEDAASNSRNSPEFRLFLTSMPCDYFPVSVLQKGIKLTNEPPTGLRANLTRSYLNVINAKDFETVAPAKQGSWKKLLFGLTFFHATIQERKKFGPLGFNNDPACNDSDLETSIQVVRMFLEEQEVVPWDALRYVVGQINYGGRVTDDLDRRCLMSILGKFFTPDILTDEYKFSPSGMYFAPPQGSLSNYLQYIETLPLTADPEIYGLNENAMLTNQRNTSNSMLATVLSIQPREIVSASGVSSDSIVSSIALDLEERMPPLLDRKKAGPETFKITAAGVMDSLGTVLSQEIDRFDRLLVTMRRTLIELQKAIRGEVVMSQELDKMFTSLLNNQVPLVWARVAYPSLKPLASWVADLNLRIQFMQEWLVEGPPTSFWLPGFFFPQGFMTGVLQNHSRKYKIPIDTLQFAFEVLDVYERSEVEQPPQDGVFIDGLYLDGARWDDELRVVADSKLGELTSRVPVIHFAPTDEPLVYNPQLYQAPCYKTSVRAGVLSTTGQSTNYVLSVALPIKHDESYWILKGAALLCQDSADDA